MTVRLEYDDDLMDAICKVNDELKKQGYPIQFECDNEEHDGFEIYELVRDDLPEGVKEFRMLIEPHTPSSTKGGAFLECECALATGPMCMDRSYCEVEKTGKTWKKHNKEEKEKD